jgi:hypothetical protein
MIRFQALYRWLLPLPIIHRENFLLFSPGQSPQELLLRHSVFERLSPIDEDNGHLLVVLLLQLGISIDVNFSPLEVGLALHLQEGIFNNIAEMASFARIHYYVVHTVIVNAGVARKLPRRRIRRRNLRTAAHVQSAARHCHCIYPTNADDHCCCVV